MRGVRRGRMWFVSEDARLTLLRKRGMRAKRAAMGKEKRVAGLSRTDGASSSRTFSSQPNFLLSSLLSSSSSRLLLDADSRSHYKCTPSISLPNKHHLGWRWPGRVIASR